MKTQLELIKNCGPEDRDVMIKSLQKHNKTMSKAYILIAIGILCCAFGLLSINILNFDYGVIGFILAPLFLIWASILPLKNAGLI